MLAFAPQRFIAMQAKTDEDKKLLAGYDSPAGRTLGALFVGLSYYYIRAGLLNETQFQRASVVGRALFDGLLLLIVAQGNLPKSVVNSAVIELLVTVWQYTILKREGNWSW